MQNKRIRSVLVIDDDRDDFDLVADVIHEIDPAIAVSYLEGCENSSQYKDRQFDLVLLDINMPAHDGFEWLTRIRQSGYALPIVMYTNSNSPAHIVKAYGEGATLYFTKPESYGELQRSIKKLLNLDWSNPNGISKMHMRDGRYVTFPVA